MLDISRFRFSIVSLRTAGEGEPPPGSPPPDPPPGSPPPPDPPPSLGWRSALPDDLKEHADLTGFKGPGDLAKAYLETKEGSAKLTEKFKGALIKPGENATEDEKKAYQKALREAMGVPATAEEYKFERPQWPEKMGAYPEQIEQEFAKTCHEAGISQAQAGALYKWYMGNVVGAFDGMDARSKQFREDAIKQLKGYWKQAFEPNVKLAERTAMLGSDTQEDMDYLRSAGFMENPVIIRVLYNLGVRTLGDKLLRDGKPPSQRGSERPKGSDGRPILKYKDEAEE